MSRRYYTPAMLGPLCAGGCGLHLPASLAAAGHTHHATCDHEGRALLEIAVAGPLARSAVVYVKSSDDERGGAQ